MRLGLVTYLVRDYDEAISYFCDILGFSLDEDTHLSDKKRWVIVTDAFGMCLLLARAVGKDQIESIGRAVGGRVAYFLYTKEFDERYQRLSEKGVNFIEAPRHETYGKVVKFLDLYGNKWDLIEEREAK